LNEPKKLRAKVDLPFFTIRTMLAVLAVLAVVFMPRFYMVIKQYVVFVFG
jgi:hypothetical protein